MTNRRDVAFSTTHSVSFVDEPMRDLDRETDFLDMFERTYSYSMTGKDAMFGLYSAVHYLLDREIPGDFVECGVWRGGSSLLAALVLKSRGITDRRMLLYDTFSGMTPATEVDVDHKGRGAIEMMADNHDDQGWCYAPLDEVKRTFAEFEVGFEPEFVVGDVIETAKTRRSDEIALLRLDTDWYESTYAELEHLYPLLAVGGVLIIDDYGYWEGSRLATDAYFETVPKPLLIRINDAVRLAIKV